MNAEILVLALIFTSITAGFAWLAHRSRRGELSVIARKTHLMTCPESKRNVEATFLETPDGARIAVESCSAFLFPEEINCGRECLLGDDAMSGDHPEEETEPSLSLHVLQ